MYYIVGFVCSCCQIICFHIFSCDFVMSATISAPKNKQTKRLDYHFFCKGFMFYLFIYIYWGPIQFHLEQDLLTLPVHFRFLVVFLLLPH